MSTEPPRPDDLDNGLDPAVARRLQPLAEVAAPDLWDAVVRRAAGAEPGGAGALTAVTAIGGSAAGPDRSADVTAIGGGAADPGRSAGQGVEGGLRSRSRRPLAWLAVAAVVVLVGAGIAVAVGRGRDGGQSIDTPASTGPPDTANTLAGFPPGVDIGPARTLDDEIPEGAFAVVYPAGAVIMGTDGAVVGHYDTGSIPTSVYDPDRAAQLRSPGPADAGCVTNRLGDIPTLLLCRQPAGPVILVPGEPPHTVASFPLGSGVTGDIVAALPAVPDLGAQPAALVQVNDDACPQRQAFLVDHLIFAGGAPQDSAPIRRLDGADLATAGPLAGESLALGWSADATEAHVWRYPSPCTPALDRPGIYAYRLDGSARLVVPTTADVIDVTLVVKEGGSIDPAARPEGWAEWAGPLRPQRTEDPALADDRRRALDFARVELGMSNPEVLATSVAEPGPTWILTENDLSLRINPYAAPFSAPATDAEPWEEVGAGTFWPDGDYSLSVTVDADSGHWTATITVPTHGEEVTATYTLGGETLDPTTTTPDGFGNVRVTFDLDAEPTDVAVLTLRWHDADTGEVVGYQRTPLPPGRFAAG